MSATLTERYVHATLRSVPEGRRDDIGAELRALISDMVDARTDAGEPVERAEREVLTELGDPARLAGRYTDAKLYLIGPRYFLVWKQVTVMLLLWVPALVATVVALLDAADGGKAVGEVVASAGGAAISVAIQVIFWVTFTFALLERFDVDAGIPEWTVDRLPDLSEDRQVSLTDTGASVAFLAVLAGALVVQHFRSWVEGPGGDDVPVLEPDLWGSWIPVLLAIVVVSIVLEIWKYRAGRWTVPIVLAEIAASLAFALSVIWLATRDTLLNPAFTEAVGLGGDGRDNLNTGIVVVAVVIASFEVVEALVKGWRARREPSCQAPAEFERPSRVG